jgi:hypothetical protein
VVVYLTYYLENEPATSLFAANQLFSSFAGVQAHEKFIKMPMTFKNKQYQEIAITLLNKSVKKSFPYSSALWQTGAASR